jgi:hypothetical protein
LCACTRAIAEGEDIEPEDGGESSHKECGYIKIKENRKKNKEKQIIKYRN